MDNNVTITANVIEGSSSNPNVTNGATVQTNVAFGTPITANVTTGGKGDKGDTGDAATIDVGTVQTVDPSDPATVTNVGSTSAAIFDFEIPKGDKGDQGDTGDGVPNGGTTAQVLRKASNTDQDTEWHTPVKADVGLGNADNTSDVNKPVSTAQQTALDGKQNLDADLTTIAAIDSSVAGALVTDGAGWIKKTYAQLKTALGLVKADVGLGNVDNTADSAKVFTESQVTNLVSDLAAKQPLDSDLTTIAGLTPTTDNFMVATASAWASRTPTQARSQMGLGSLAVLSTVTEADITLADNTTNNFSTTKHGFVPKGTNTGNFLKDDGTWAAIPGGGDMLASTYDPATIAQQVVGLTATQTLTNKTLTSPKINENVALTASATELNVLDGIPATLTPTELGYVDGVTSAIQTQIDGKQPLDADLTTIAGLTATTDNFLQAKSSAWASRTPAQVLADLAAVGTTFQPLDNDLTTIAGLTATTDNFLVATASAWASRTPSQARTQMGLGTLATNSSVTNALLSTSAGEIGAAWQSWTPTLTNFTGTINVAKYIQIGKTCHFYLKITQGASVTGQHIFSLPLTASANEPAGGIGSANGNIIATGAIQDAGTGYFIGLGVLQSTTTCALLTQGSAATYATLNASSPTIPMTWAASNDAFVLHGTYEVA